MNWECKVEVDVNAYYDFVKPRELDVSVREYTRQNCNCYMSDDKCRLYCNKTITLRFDSFADMCANFEKELLNELNSCIKFIDNWNVKYTIKQISGSDVYF